jgi:hypothetical protein
MLFHKKKPRDEKGLRLLALEPEDAPVLSAHVQDASVRVGDMAFLPERRRFVMMLSRFDWVAAHEGAKARRRTGLHFEHVLEARQQNVPQQTPDVVLNLLAIDFSPDNAPSGWVTLLFSGDASIRLRVECFEGALRDLEGGVWPAHFKPRHRLGRK